MTDEDLIKYLQAWYFPECHIVYLIETRIEQLKQDVSVWKKAHSDACRDWREVYLEREFELLERIKELERELQEKQHD